MTPLPANATRVEVQFRDCTAGFFRDYPAYAAPLRKRAYLVEENSAVAEAIYPNDSEDYWSLCYCGSRLAGNTLASLRPTFYCKNKYCNFCSEIRAHRRKDQMVDCCRKFANAIEFDRLQMYRYVLHVDAPESDPVRKVFQEYQLLQKLRRSLVAWHKRKNRQLYTKLKQDKTPSNRAEKQKYLGPVTFAVHINAPINGSPLAALPHVHLHLNVVTYPGAGKKQICNDLNSMWNAVITGSYPNAYGRGQFACTTEYGLDHKSNSGLSQKGEFGHLQFDPFEIEDKGITTSRMLYLGRHTKHELDPSWKIWHYRWLNKTGLLRKRFYYCLPAKGPLGTRCKPLPGDWEDLADQKMFQAQCYGDNFKWRVSQMLTENRFSVSE